MILKKLGKDMLINEANGKQVGPRAWRGLPKRFSHLLTSTFFIFPSS